MLQTDSNGELQAADFWQELRPDWPPEGWPADCLPLCVKVGAYWDVSENIDIGKSVVHLALATHLFNVFSPNIAPKISVPVASCGFFRSFSLLWAISWGQFHEPLPLGLHGSSRFFFHPIRSLPSVGPNSDRCSSPDAGCRRDVGSRCGETQMPGW